MSRLLPVTVAIRTLRRQRLPSRCQISDAQAVEWLRRVTGQDFGTDAEAWAAWLRRNRWAYYRPVPPANPRPDGPTGLIEQRRGRAPPMNTRLLRHLIPVREKAKTALATRGPHGYLPVLIQYLDLVEEVLRQGPSHPRYRREERQRMLGGFGKMALDDYAFAESELGQKMFDVMNRFAEGP